MEVVFDHHAVLLAEDNPDDAMLMAKAWVSAGLKNPLSIVPDGERALAYLRGQAEYADRRKHPFPIAMFLDLKLPRVDGLEVLRAVRADPELRCLSIDVLSASARTNDVERALELGANSYLIKPSRFDSLVQMLTAWQALARSRLFVVVPLSAASCENAR